MWPRHYLRFRAYYAFLFRGIPLLRCASENREIFRLRKAEPTAVRGNGAEVIADKNIVSSLSQ